MSIQDFAASDGGEEAIGAGCFLAVVCGALGFFIGGGSALLIGVGFARGVGAAMLVAPVAAIAGFAIGVWIFRPRA